MRLSNEHSYLLKGQQKTLTAQEVHNTCKLNTSLSPMTTICWKCVTSVKKCDFDLVCVNVVTEQVAAEDHECMQSCCCFLTVMRCKMSV